MRDQIAIVQSFKQTSTSENCCYWQIKFFGKKFAPEMRYSKHGFIMRAKQFQEVAALIDELRCIYKISPLCFKSISGVSHGLKTPEGKIPEPDQEEPFIILVPINPLTEDV